MINTNKTDDKSLTSSLLAFASLFLSLSCSHKVDNAKDEMRSLYSAPVTVLLDTLYGYKLNTVTGDSIKPLINSMGVRVTTGRPVPATGKVIEGNSASKPKVIQAGKPSVVAATTNSTRVPDDLTIMPVDESKLRKVKVGEGNPDFVLVNSTGDTIPTGVPIPINGTVVPCIQPRPTLALPPRMKDNALADLQYIDVDQGMNSSSFMSAFIDKNGYLWLGTRGAGVSRYNGRTLTHYSEKEGFSKSYVTSIIEDKSGNLWFGTGSGLSRFDGKTFTHYTEKEGLINNNVWSLLEDKSGNLWFGTEGGVSRYDGKSIIHYTQKEGLSGNQGHAILEDKNGNIWFGTNEGATKYDGSSFTHYTDREGLSSNKIQSILEDQSGNIWFGTFEGGVCRYDGKTFTHYTEKEGLSDNSILSMYEDKGGNLWYSTLTGGVNRFDGKTFTRYTKREGLSHNEVWSILEDKNGNLWFGTDGGGEIRYNPKSFIDYTAMEGLSTNEVRTILEDQNGNIWYGTDGRGVSRYDGKSFTQYTERQGLSSNDVWSMMEDRSGNLWISTWRSGVNLYDGKSFTHFTQKEGFSNVQTNSILEDKVGNIWFGTSGEGLIRYGFHEDGNGSKVFTHYTDKEGLSNNHIQSIVQDKSGNLWVATGGGVSKYDGKSFTNYTEKEGLSGNSVTSILEDKSGNLWFGTSEGLSKFNGTSFVHYTQKTGLSNNNVTSILEDKKGDLWVGTDKGINHVVFGSEQFIGKPGPTKKISVSDSLTIYVYAQMDGLKGTNFMQNSALLDSKNRAWWGTGKSMVMLDLENNTPATKPPVVRLTQVDIEEQFIDFQNLPNNLINEISFSGVEKFSNYPLNLELPYQLNHLTFHYTGMDCVSPYKVSFSYKLEGLSNEWSEPSTEGKADYRNLPYGNYNLKIRAIGESNEWSLPFTYSFSIRPPWWHAWWAYGLYGICLLGSIYIVDRTQRRRLIAKEREKTRDRELAQAREIEKAYHDLKTTQSQLIQSEKMASLGELTAGIAHEIQNPLNFVNNFSEVNTELIDELQHELKTGKIDDAISISNDIKDNEQKINHHGKRADAIVKGMLQHSRTSSGQKEPTDINALCDEYLRLSYHGLRAKDKTFNATLNTDYDQSIGNIDVVPQDIGRVILNLVNNAFYAVRERSSNAKASGNKDYEPTVSISTKKSGNKVLITVKDNGNGIPQKVLDKIFQPFFTTKPPGQGTGLGLSLSYDIVKAHGGEISTESKEGEGCAFTIHLNNI